MRNTLVIIDDNELDLAILNEIFKDVFLVRCFSSTPKAISYLHENESSVAIILLDICLGKTGAGFNVLQHIQGHKSLKNIPIVLITSDANEGYVKEAIKNGATDFLVKPVDPHSVRERVSQVLKKIWSEDEMCMGEQALQENEAQQTEFTIDEIKKLSKQTLDKIQALCKIRNVISISECMAIHKITTLLAKTYLQTPESSIDEIDAEMISYASTFYDIGRLGIPDDCIQSDFDNNLSDTYAKHINIGQDLFLANQINNKFYQYCSEITYWHHKNFDGSGYPLVNTSNIPISAQLVRAALRFYFYTQRFKDESKTLDRVLNSLSSEINHTISYQMYEVIKLSYESLSVLIDEI